MRTHRQLIAVIFSLVTLVPGLKAQTTENNIYNYRTAIGLRAGRTSGITLNVNTNKSAGLEFIAGIWTDWVSLACLYEKRVSAFNVDGLRWFYGAGGHIGLATGTYYNGGKSYSGGEDYALGIDGTVGLEYKIPQIPFAVNIGLKPFLEIYRNGSLYLNIDPGIGIKLTF